MNVVKEITILNLSLYLLFCFLIAGCCFGIFECIERSYATGYYLDTGSKIIAMIYTTCQFALYNLFLGVILTAIIIVTLYLMFLFKNLLDNKKVDILFLWVIPVIVLSLLYTSLILSLYFTKPLPLFTDHFLFNNVISTLIMYKFTTFPAIIIAALGALILEKKKGYNFIKTFLTLLVSAVVILSAGTFYFNKANHLFNFFNSLYKSVYSDYQSNQLIISLGIFLLFFAFFFIFCYISILILPRLWKYRAFKIIVGMLFLFAFSFFYLFTFNFLAGQSFYIDAIGEIHYHTGLISLLYFNFLVIFILYSSNIKPSAFLNYEKKTTSLILLAILVLMGLLLVYIKPRSNMLMAFFDKTAIIQKHLERRWAYPLVDMKVPKVYTLPEKELCIIYPDNPRPISLKKKSNVFLISVDALRTDFALDKKYAPNINKFFDNSYTFTNNYSHATHTPASLSSIATSKYFAEPITALEPTLATELVKNGYETRAFAGINLANSKLIMDRTYINDIMYPSPIINGYKNVKIPTIKREDTDKRMLKDAINALKDISPDGANLLWFHIYQLHETPVSKVYSCFITSKPFIKEYQKRLKEADSIFGQYIKALKDNNLYENSLIVLFSDHGEEIKEHGSFFHTFSLYNELIRVPLAIKLPGKTNSRVFEQPVSSLDLAPTVLDYLGAEVTNINFCGESLLPIINETPHAHKLPLSSLYRGFYYYRSSTKNIESAVLMNKKPLKYHVREAYSHAIIDEKNQWKLIYNFFPEYFELYNLKKDPEEKRNLADNNPEIVEHLFLKLKEQLKIKGN